MRVFHRIDPNERRRENKTFGVLEAHAVHVRNVSQQTDDLLWTYDAELIGLFDRVYGIAASVR